MTSLLGLRAQRFCLTTPVASLRGWWSALCLSSGETFCRPGTGLDPGSDRRSNSGSPALSWFTLEQVVDLKAEGLWEELLDGFQPEVVVQDW